MTDGKVTVVVEFDAMDEDEADRISEAVRTLITELHLAGVRIERHSRVR